MDRGDLLCDELIIHCIKSQKKSDFMENVIHFIWL